MRSRRPGVPCPSPSPSLPIEGAGQGISFRSNLNCVIVWLASRSWTLHAVCEGTSAAQGEKSRNSPHCAGNKTGDPCRHTRIGGTAISLGRRHRISRRPPSARFACSCCPPALFHMAFSLLSPGRLLRKSAPASLSVRRSGRSGSRVQPSASCMSIFAILASLSRERKCEEPGPVVSFCRADAPGLHVPGRTFLSKLSAGARGGAA